MHPLKELISSLTGQPSAKSAARTEAVQAAQTKAQAAPPAQLPAAAPAQTPVGTSTGFGQPSFLAGAATTPATQQNTAVKTLLGQ